MLWSGLGVVGLGRARSNWLTLFAVSLPRVGEVK